jgi:hypothetical protein
MDITDISAGARRRAERALDQAWDRGDLASSEAVQIVLDALIADHPALGAAAVALQRWCDAGIRPLFILDDTIGYPDIARVVINAVDTYAAEQAESATEFDAEPAPQSEPEFAVGDVVEWYHGSELRVGQIIPNDVGRVSNAEDYYHIDRDDGLTSYVRKGAVRAATPVAPWIPKIGDQVEWDYDNWKHYGRVANPPHGAVHGQNLYWVEIDDGSGLYINPAKLRPDHRRKFHD